MKKFLIIVLPLLIFLVSGCGSSNNSQENFDAKMKKAAKNAAEELAEFKALLALEKITAEGNTRLTVPTGKNDIKLIFDSENYGLGELSQSEIEFLKQKNLIDVPSIPENSNILTSNKYGKTIFSELYNFRMADTAVNLVKNKNWRYLTEQELMAEINAKYQEMFLLALLKKLAAKNEMYTATLNNFFDNVKNFSNLPALEQTLPKMPMYDSEIHLPKLDNLEFSRYIRKDNAPPSPFDKVNIFFIDNQFDPQEKIEVGIFESLYEQHPNIANTEGVLVTFAFSCKPSNSSFRQFVRNVIRINNPNEVDEVYSYLGLSDDKIKDFPEERGYFFSIRDNALYILTNDFGSTKLTFCVYIMEKQK